MVSDTDNGRPDAGSDEPAPIGQRLREAREALGLSEAQVAQALHLDASVVHALEAGDFDSLGAPIFVKGHLRNYARLVKLDPAAIVAAYEALDANGPPVLSATGPGGIRMDERGGWGSRIAWIVLALIVAAIGFWIYQTNQLSGLVQTGNGPQTSPTVQPPAAQSSFTTPETSARQAGNAGAAGVSEPATASLATPANQTGILSGGAALAEPESSGHSAAVGITEPNRPAQTAVASPVIPGASSKARPAATDAEQQTKSSIKQAEASGGLSLALRLIDDSWVEVDDVDGERLYYGLAHQGDTVYLSGKPPLRLFLGNAPMVRVLAAGSVIDTAEFTRSDNTARFTIHKPDDNPAYADRSAQP